MIHSNVQPNQSVNMEILSNDQRRDIIQTAKQVLEDTGCTVLHSSAKEMLEQAGALVQGDHVKIPRFLVEESLRSAPEGIFIYDRNGKPAMDLGGTRSYYGTSTASPKTKDALTGEIHPTRVADIAAGAKVADALDNIDWVMPFGSSQDVPAIAADIYEFEAVVTNTSKPMAFCGYSARGVELIFEMAALVAGGRENLKAKPFLLAYPEPISPLVYPEEVIDKMYLAADWGIPQITTGAGQPGATSPVTLAGTMVQMVAEAMASSVMIQLRQKGAPMFFAANFGMFDMRTGLNSMASPEASLMQGAMAEIARDFRLPSWGYAGATDSKRLDAQAGIESAFSILAQGMAGINLIHDVGYMDMAMVCSADMLVMGNEVVGMAKRFINGIRVTPESLATDVIHRVGPGGNFLQEPHTLSNFKNAWYPELFTRESRATWESRGKKDLAEKCSDKVKAILESHTPEALSDDIRQALETIRIQGEKELNRKAA